MNQSFRVATQFAKHNLRSWRGEYYAIDAWQYRPKDDKDKNYKDDATNDKNYAFAYNNTLPHRARTHLLRALSVPAAATFPEGYFVCLPPQGHHH